MPHKLMTIPIWIQNEIESFVHFQKKKKIEKKITIFSLKICNFFMVKVKFLSKNCLNHKFILIETVLIEKSL